MYYTNTYTDIYNSDELIILIEINKKRLQSQIVYIDVINSVLSFIAKYYKVKYIYSHTKLWEYINEIAQIGNIGITITLITDEDNQEVDDIRSVYRNSLIEENHNHLNSYY